MQSRRVRLLGAILSVAVCVGCSTGMNSTFRDGYKAELKKDWDTALIDYDKAVQSDPENSKYLIHEKEARTESSIYHLNRGKALLASNRLDDASGEFQKAVSVDPTNQAAAQELNRVLAQQAEIKNKREKNLTEALKSREEDSYSDAVQLQPFPQEVIGRFHLSADSKVVYEALGKLADLNVAFSSDFQPRPLTMDLSKIKVEDALRLV